MSNGNSIGQKAAVRLNLEGPAFARIEDWRRSQLKIPSRSRAILDLVEQALRDEPFGQNCEDLRAGAPK
jgi:hypothetical protein